MAKKLNRDNKENNGEDDFLASLCYGDETHDGAESRGSNAWLLFLHLLVAPNVGWRRVKNSRITVEDYARVLYYPLLALVAACRFAEMMYYTGHGLGFTLQRAIALFVAGFAGYFLITLLARTFLPQSARCKIDSRYGKLFILSVLGALALGTVIAELLPWLGMLLMVLPIYCAYILAKGVRYLRIPIDETVPTTILMTVLCIGVPTGIYYVLTLMMPAA